MVVSVAEAPFLGAGTSCAQRLSQAREMSRSNHHQEAEADRKEMSVSLAIPWIVVAAASLRGNQRICFITHRLPWLAELARISARR